jgi:uroporphyrinogen decarboxylase
MIEGGGSRHYLEVKKLMYNSPEVWDELVGKLVDVLAEYAASKCAPAPMRCKSSTAGSGA